LYCWGANGSGRLGLGDEADRSRPVRVVGDVQWTSVAAGSGHSCGLDEAGTVYCWGDNRRGQLGQGDRAARSLPSPVMLPRSATSISASFDHSCAVLLDATLYCWGSNGEGELGQADALAGEDQSAADALEPIRVPLDDVRSIDNGQGHTCAIRLDGALFCWGRNSSHELGPETRIQVREPLRIGSDGDWLVVDAGQNHTCALKEDRSAWCWGENVGSIDDEGSPLGLEADIVDEPTRIADVAFRELATDTFHTCALSADDELSCWGRNVEGQLGLGDLDLRRAPARVDAGYASIGLSRFGTCAIARSGELRCTGKNDVGELGVGDAERRNRLTPVAFP
jgi:alpha-tubulin suppressor-like RCC1 family protein